MKEFFLALVIIAVTIAGLAWLSTSINLEAYNMVGDSILPLLLTIAPIIYICLFIATMASRRDHPNLLLPGLIGWLYFLENRNNDKAKAKRQYHPIINEDAEKNNDKAKAEHQYSWLIELQYHFPGDPMSYSKKCVIMANNYEEAISSTEIKFKKRGYDVEAIKSGRQATQSEVVHFGPPVP